MSKHSFASGIECVIEQTLFCKRNWMLATLVVGKFVLRYWCESCSRSSCSSRCLLSLFYTNIPSQLCAFCSLFRPQNVFERIAELWNRSAFNALAPPLAYLEGFMTLIDCRHNLVVHLAPRHRRGFKIFLPRRARTSYKLYLTGR